MSEKIDTGGSAFPSEEPVEFIQVEGKPESSHPSRYGIVGGMTLLDYFAAKALPIVVGASPKSDKKGFQIEAEISYAIAQAMLAEKRRIEGGL